jgi:hypothetical protein
MVQRRDFRDGGVYKNADRNDAVRKAEAKILRENRGNLPPAFGEYEACVIGARLIYIANVFVAEEAADFYVHGESLA